MPSHHSGSPLIVLVTDGEQRASLALARSLGSAGHEVHVCSAAGRSLAGASRYCRSEWKVADALASPDAYVRDVRDVLRKVGGKALIPVSEASLLALLAPGDAVPDVLIPFPDLPSFRRICDKAYVLDHARSVGICVPRQAVLTSAAVEGLQVPFPVVVKPSRSVVERDGRRFKTGVRYADDAGQLKGLLLQLDPAEFPVLVQQRVVGPGVGIFLLRWDGEIVAAFAHRRIREKPPSGGVSVYRESIRAEPTLLARSSELLSRLGWRGVAMVEYKVDAATGEAYLMEINGRFWGSLQLAIDAGVDFPRLLVDAARGLRPAPVLSWRTGVRSRWWWGDVDQMLARLLRSRRALALPPDEPGRLAALGQFLVPWRPGDRNEVFRLSDPWPLVRESWNWIRAR